MMIMIMMSLSFRCDSMAASMFCFCFNQEMMDGIFQWDSVGDFSWDFSPATSGGILWHFTHWEIMSN